MTSSAISAQGSSFGIASSTAPAASTASSVTPTTSALGTTTLITTTAAHGLQPGAVVALSAFAGTGAATLNGNSYGVTIVSPTSFTIQVNTFGLVFTAATGSVQGTTYLYVANFRTFNGLDGQASEIDVTNMASKAKEIRLGLVDFGQLQLEMDHNSADPGQAQLQVQYLSGALTLFVLMLPNGNTASFTGFVRKFSMQGGVDQVVKRQCDVRISGQVTWC